MSQWLWNPSSLNLGMNLLAATPSCDWLLSVVTVRCNTQLWLSATTPSCYCPVGEDLWVWDTCVLHCMVYIYFSFTYNTSIKIHMLYFNIISFLRVAATTATDCVSQYRCSMLEIVLYGCLIYLNLHHQKNWHLFQSLCGGQNSFINFLVAFWLEIFTET